MPTSPASLEPLESLDLTTSITLVLRARDGDRQALNDLLERYQGRVQRIARIRMGARLRSFMESDDIVQRTFMVAAEKLGTFEARDHSSIIRWLSRILENQIHDAVDFVNAARRDPDRVVGLDAREGDAPFDLVGRAADPADVAAQTELQELFDTCVERLDGDFCEVVLLRDYAGCSWAEVARELGRPSAAASSELYRRAKIKLARMLGSLLPKPE